MELIEITRQLRDDVAKFHFGGSVACSYNPLSYAWQAHKSYLRRYGNGQKEVLLLGMNPGPFGMAQTGVPFGDAVMVREWLAIEEEIGHPEDEHPKRPVEGFLTRRREISGSRLWGWAAARFGSADNFFSRFFVVNYCPLLFLNANGSNITPEKLPKSELLPLYEVCDRAIYAMAQVLQPRFVIGVGKFAEDRARQIFADSAIITAGIIHPSPANPQANRGWSEKIEQQLQDIGVKVKN